MQGHVSCGGWKGSAGEGGRDDDLCKKPPERKLGYISPGSKLRPQLTTPHGCGFGSSNTPESSILNSFYLLCSSVPGLFWWVAL